MFQLEFEGKEYQLIELSEYGDKIMFAARPINDIDGATRTGAIYTRHKEMLRLEFDYRRVSNGLSQLIPVEAFGNIAWIKYNDARIDTLGNALICFDNVVKRLDVTTMLFAHQRHPSFDDPDKMFFMGGSLYGCYEVRFKDNTIIKRSWFRDWRGKLIPEWTYHYRGEVIAKPIVIYNGI